MTVMLKINKIAVLGAGIMGMGIAQTMAARGYEVMLVYVYDDKLRAKPLETIGNNLKTLCAHGLLKEEQIPEILGRIRFTESMEEAAAFADIIFESIVERLDVKQEYFRKLDQLCPPTTILATNTSAISVTEIAETSVHKERIIGTHFWNPAYLIPLVEVVRTEYVSDDTVERTYAFLEEAGKAPVIVQKDVPGFIGNRMQHAMFREALSIVERGIATPEDVDKTIKNGFGLRMGIRAPIEVMDAGGMDLTYNVHSYLFPHIENSKEPSPILTRKLEEGKLGFKSGEGILKWSREDIEASIKRLDEGLIEVMKALGKFENTI